MSSDDLPFKPRPPKMWLSFMAGLAHAAGDMRACEGYLLQLLSYCVLPHQEELGL